MTLSRIPALHPIQNTSAVLIAQNPVLEYGRIAMETDTNRVKSGDGVSTYTQLTYVEWNYEIVEAAGTDTYTGNFSKPFLLTYFPMMRIRVRFANANTGAATINLNGLGAIAIRKSVSAALSAGDIMAGGIYELSYDGTNFQIPAAVGGTASTPSLTATYVGFGSGANVLTGSANLVWTGAQLTVNGTVSSTGYQISGAAATGTILRGNGTSYVASTNTYPNTTGAGQILYATSANVIGSSSSFVRLSTGEVILGATSLIGTELLSLQTNANASTNFRISNTTSGTAAKVATILSNAANNLTFELLSAAFTTSGMRVQNSSVILANTTAGLNVGTNVAGPTSLWTNNTEKVRLTSGGELIAGTNFTPSLTAAGGAYLQSRGLLAAAVVENTTASGTTSGGSLFLLSNDGAAVVNTDRLGVLTFGGYNGTIVTSGSVIRSFATETWSGTQRGNRMVFLTTGNTTTTITDRLSIEQNGSVVVGDNTAALATTATGGFLYIPTCAGTPTGAPVAQTGTVPIIFDTTNAKLYIYSGGAWLGGTTPGAFT